jgi:hypothetical protein
MRAVLLALLLLPAAVLAADEEEPKPLALFPATGVNVPEGYVAASTDVLRAFLERTGKFRVVLLNAPANGKEARPDQAGEAATAAEATRAMTLRISRLGNNAMVRVVAYTDEGKQAWADQLTASGPDDLESVLRRLAEAFATGEPSQQLASIDTVTQKEADAYLKYAATNVFGIALGVLVPLNRPSDAGSNVVYGGGLFWLYDARSFLAEVNLDLNTGEGNTAFALGLGAYYPFQKGNISPFAGVGAAFSHSKFGGDGATGLTLKATGGVLVGRLSSVQIRVEGGWFLNTYAEAPTGAGAEKRVHGPWLSAGIGF